MAFLVGNMAFGSKSSTLMPVVGSDVTENPLGFGGGRTVKKDINFANVPPTAAIP